MFFKTAAVLALVAQVGCSREKVDAAPPEKIDAATSTTAAPSQQKPLKSWSVSITTSGGFTGHGAGGVSATSEGTLSATHFLGTPTPCADVTLPEETAHIRTAVEAADPDQWTSSYAHASNPEGCCDQYQYTLKLEVTRQDDTTRDFTTHWYDDSKENLPRDLRGLSGALWDAKQKIAAKCAE